MIPKPKPFIDDCDDLDADQILDKWAENWLRKSGELIERLVWAPQFVFTGTFNGLYV